MAHVIPGIEPRTFTRIDGHGRQATEDLVAIEEPLQVLVDGKPVAVLMRTPGKEKELAVGFCLSEGVIARFDDIGLVQHCGRSVLDPQGSVDDLDVSRNIVNVTLLRREAAGHDGRADILRLVRSGCGRTDPDELATTLPAVTGALRVPASVLMGLTRKLVAGQEAYRQAGGLHAVALFAADGELVVIGEDIGRHNAMDKTLGHCYLRGIPLHDKIAFSTGRASYEMVLKAVRAGVPILISRSSATSLAIDLAERLNCTLIGYARGERMTIYAHPERVLDEPAQI
jgi:FdhD protein